MDEAAADTPLLGSWSRFFVSYRLPNASAVQRQVYDATVAALGEHNWTPEDFSIDNLATTGITIHEILT